MAVAAAVVGAPVPPEPELALREPERVLREPELALREPERAPPEHGPVLPEEGLAAGGPRRPG